jgi:hypothetical protein
MAESGDTQTSGSVLASDSAEPRRDTFGGDKLRPNLGQVKKITRISVAKWGNFRPTVYIVHRQTKNDSYVQHGDTTTTIMTKTTETYRGEKH